MSGEQDSHSSSNLNSFATTIWKQEQQQCDNWGKAFLPTNPAGNHRPCCSAAENFLGWSMIKPENLLLHSSPVISAENYTTQKRLAYVWFSNLLEWLYFCERASNVWSKTMKVSNLKPFEDNTGHCKRANMHLRRLIAGYWTDYLLFGNHQPSTRWPVGIGAVQLCSAPSLPKILGMIPIHTDQDFLLPTRLHYIYYTNWKLVLINSSFNWFHRLATAFVMTALCFWPAGQHIWTSTDAIASPTYNWSVTQHNYN